MIGQMEGAKHRGGKERVGEEVGVGNGRRATAVKDKTGSIPWMSPVAKSGWGLWGKVYEAIKHAGMTRGPEG